MVLRQFSHHRNMGTKREAGGTTMPKTVRNRFPKADDDEYWRGLNKLPMLFGGVPYYSCSIMGPKILF